MAEGKTTLLRILAGELKPSDGCELDAVFSFGWDRDPCAAVGLHHFGQYRWFEPSRRWLWLWSATVGCVAGALGWGPTG
ncbi:hypothetical protein Ahu01nite_031850 [Winogradskya humida]|uniref:Uncharacterized protein n=1 Tax=Winogradskya humida TaxID=113566 RepID=A0ABQ3ZNF7_9ACTN|nr:hypothetical protein Ahu01nite_031850 [Actinoplanes humidus]